jgi:hypothetical protein
MIYKHYKYGYYVINVGKVIRMCKNNKRQVKLLESKSGYLYFHIFQNNENIFIHKAVAQLYLEKTDKTRYIIDHINRNKKDNSSKNLRYVNHSENMLNRSKWGKWARGEK